MAPSSASTRKQRCCSRWRGGWLPGRRTRSSIFLYAARHFLTITVGGDRSTWCCCITASRSRRRGGSRSVPGWGPVGHTPSSYPVRRGRRGRPMITGESGIKSSAIICGGTSPPTRWCSPAAARRSSWKPTRSAPWPRSAPPIALASQARTAAPRSAWADPAATPTDAGRTPNCMPSTHGDAGSGNGRPRQGTRGGSVHPILAPQRLVLHFAVPPGPSRLAPASRCRGSTSPRRPQRVNTALEVWLSRYERPPVRRTPPDVSRVCPDQTIRYLGSR